ncbi:MAG TPA: UvrD-helicase domain-containing protein, partial [Spirochaetia bacterium]|nr:UvrD-helicase domain-containing protein [Spirochaetia bacterium]
GVRTMEHARKLAARLSAIGNIASDGRPILGLDPKDLLSILLETDPEGFLIPAHVWTPWFSIFGSKSGFDRIEDCFEELTPHIFALETGLSSDPPMNWRWSALDGYRLVSNSDAHSPPNLGREATLLDAELGWEGVVGALRTGKGFVGTCEFYPEEGKYHFDGHRKCGVCMDPEETRKKGTSCPVCGGPITVGVLHRVLELADRRAPRKPENAGGFRYLIPVPEILGQLSGSGVGSRTVAALHAKVIRSFGSEYSFLFESAPEDIERALGPLIAEAVRRMRDGKVTPSPGYDGEFGVIRMFDDQELARLRGQDELFPTGSSRKGRAQREGSFKAQRTETLAGEPVLELFPRPPFLDEEQRVIVESAAGKSLVLAGPGTGKTRLLTSWIARHIEKGLAAPEEVLALTFTTRAAAEMRERLFAQLGKRAGPVSATTFHSFCFGLLRLRDPGLVTVYNASQRVSLLGMLPGLETQSRARLAAQRLERFYEGLEDLDEPLAKIIEEYDKLCADTAGVDVSSLVSRTLKLFHKDPGFLAEQRLRYRVIAVDELQDINKPQFELVSALSESASALLCIGDPDQAIYGFRGSDRSLFLSFRDQPEVLAFDLASNYRSSATLVRASAAVIAAQREPGTTILRAARPGGPPIRVFPAADPAEEGDYIASSIRRLVGGVDSVSVDEAREAAHADATSSHSFADIAVLFRTRAVRDAMLPAFLRAGLPLAFRDNAPLIEEEPFNRLVAGLRLITNPADPVSRKDLGPSFAAFLPRLQDLQGLVVSRGIEAAIDEIEDSVVRIDRKVPEVALADEAIRESAREHGNDLPSFLASLSLLTRESEGARTVERVTLLTLHAAKGLEFPIVFIAGAEEGIIPLGDDPDEERRLFYVAMTRAKDLLFITHCAQRFVHGALTPSRPSPFLAGIPADCIEHEQSRRRVRRSDGQLDLFG